MNIDVLALKYRPKFFEEVVGQELVIKTLSNSIDLNKLHHERYKELKIEYCVYLS